jgi:hypothetical protein
LTTSEGAPASSSGRNAPEPDAAQVVRGDHLLDPLRRQVDEAAPGRDARVRDEQVYGRVALADPRRGRLQLRPVGDVADVGLGADLRCGSLQPLGAARQEDAAPAALGQQPRGGGLIPRPR